MQILAHSATVPPMEGSAQGGIGALREVPFFSATRWSVVLAAGDPGSPQADEALQTLCRTYWYPLYAYIRRHGYGPMDAEDLTQEFFARMLEKGSLHAANPERGRFRWFLLASLRHFLANDRDRVLAQKRGGGFQFISLDTAWADGRYAQEPSHELTAEQLYERSWAVSVIEKARRQVQEEFQAAGKAERFEMLEQLLPGESPKLTLAEAATALAESEGAVKTEVYRLKQRLGRCLRAEIAQTVADPAEVEAEIQHLMEVFG